MKYRALTLSLLFSFYASHAATQKIEKNNITITMIDYGMSPDQKIVNDLNITLKNILNQNAYPIQISIKNNSDKTIILSPKSFNVSSVDYSRLAKDLHYHEIIRPILTFLAINFGVKYSFGLTACLATAITENPLPLIIFGTIDPLITFGNLIGNIKNWWDLRKTNQKIDDYLCHRLCLNKAFVLKPNSQLTKVVLLNKNEALSVPELTIDIYEKGAQRNILETFDFIIG